MAWYGALLANWRARLAGVSEKHVKFSGVEFLFWFSAAASGYLTVFLQGRGMTSSQVGVIGALNAAVGIVAAPFWGMISDKLRSLRKVLILCLALAALLWAAVPASSNVLIGSASLAIVVIPLGSFFRVPAGSLLDSWVVQNANRHRLNYGAIRLWGSISYAVMSMSLSALLPIIGVEATFWIYALTAVPLIVLCLRVKDDGRKVKALPLRQMRLGRLFGNYYFVTYLIFSVALNMPVNTSFSFLPFLMREMGVPTEQLGIIMGYKALLEIPVLLMMVKLRRRFALPLIMGAAALLYTTEHFLYYFAGGLPALLAVSTLHGVAGGAFIGSGSNYIYTLAPEELKATAQTVGGSMNALAGIVGNLMGGYLMDAMGVRNFYLIAGCMILFALLFFAASFPLGRLLRKRLPPSAQRASL